MNSVTKHTCLGLDNLPSEVLHLLVELRGKEEQAQAARKKIGQQEAGLVALYRTHSYTPPGRHAQREKAFIKEVEEGFEELRRLTDEKIDVSGKITTLVGGIVCMRGPDPH